MNVPCSGCGKNYRVDDARLEGKSKIRLRCTSCGSVFDVDVVAGPVEGVRGPAPPAKPAGGAVGPDATPGARGEARRTPSGEVAMGTPELPIGKRVSLAILSGPDQGKVIPLERPRIVVGRSDADLVVNDPEISRRHAVLEVYGDRFVVRDLESTNGTFVEERRITVEELDNHEEFRIGMTRMMLIVTVPDD